jgi:hypothetical protein
MFRRPYASCQPKKTTEEMVLSSARFGSLRGDLADAERAPRRREKAAAPGHAERRVDYRHLVDGLEAALRQAVRERDGRRGQQSGAGRSCLQEERV